MKAIQNSTLNLNFVKKKNSKTFLKHIHSQSQVIYDDKINFKKSRHTFEDCANGVQVGDFD